MDPLEDPTRAIADLRRAFDEIRGELKAYRSLEQARTNEMKELHQLRITLETERKRSREELSEANNGMVQSIQRMFEERKVDNQVELAAIRASQLEKEARDRMKYLTVLIPAGIAGLGMILRLPLEAVASLAAAVYLLTTKGVESVARKDPQVSEERSKSMRPPPVPPAPDTQPMIPLPPQRARMASYSEIHGEPPSEKIDRTRR